MEEKNNVNPVEYKKGCGFRFKINRCGFKEHDCKKEVCSMYDIEWNKDSLSRKIESETEEVKRLSSIYDNTIDKKEKKKINNQIQDTQIGIAYLIEALFFITRGHYLQYKEIKRVYGLGFLGK